jgi:DNA-binding CsgD family transcriptional regulator/predicted ATPase
MTDSKTPRPAAQGRQSERSAARILSISAGSPQEPELETLVQVMARVDDGEGCPVLVIGAPGAGKTHLADSLSRWVKGQGGRGLWTSCEAAPDAPAFWPWLRLLRDYLEGRASETFPSELKQRMAEVIQMMPAVDSVLQGYAVPEAVETATARFRLFDAVTRVLRRVSEDDLILVVMDDLNEADDSSLELLRHVGNELWGSRIMLIGLHRPLSSRSSASLRATVEVLARARGAQTIELKGPDRDPTRDSSLGLSARESEVAALVVEGLTNHQIGERLFISERTAENHIQSILNKLGFTNRAQVAAWVERAGNR